MTAISENVTTSQSVTVVLLFLNDTKRNLLAILGPKSHIKVLLLSLLVQVVPKRRRHGLKSLCIAINQA